MRLAAGLLIREIYSFFALPASDQERTEDQHGFYFYICQSGAGYSDICEL